MQLSGRHQNGFTLIELLLAMALFSLGFLVIVTGFITLLSYYQTANSSRVVQTAARTGIDSIVQSGRQGNWFAYNDDPAAYAICINASPRASIIYYVDSGSHALMEGTWDSTRNCTPTSVVAGTPQPVTSSDAEVVDLIPEQTEGYDLSTNPPSTTPCNTSLPSCPAATQLKGLRLTLRVATRVDQLNATHTDCQPTRAACVITALTTSLTAAWQVEAP